jgi:opacity protein-like surface antigen
LFLAVVLCGSPRNAGADYLFIPFIGGAFAGRTAFLNLEQGAGATQLIFGGSAGWLSSGVLGVEADFAYAPRFFERDNLAGVIQGSNAMTLSGSVIAAVPLGITQDGLRPYLTGGLGLVHSAITYTGLVDPVDDNSLGLNVGAGAIGFFTPRTGVRFELRHFRTLERDVNPATGDLRTRLSFWRATVGVVIRR